MHFDSVVITGGVTVQSQYDFGIVVPDAAQGLHFAVKGFLGGHVSGDLEIGQDALFLGDKIDFCCPDFADVHPVAAAQQFEIDDVFQRKSQVVLMSWQNMVAQAQVNHIPFFVGLEELFANHVKALDRIKDEGLRERFHIVVNCIWGDFPAAGGQVVSDTFDGNRGADDTGQIAGDGLEQGKVCHFAFGGITLFAVLAILDVPDDDRMVDTLKVGFHFVIGSVHGGNIRHPAVFQVIGKGLVGRQAGDFNKFLE